MAKSVNKAIILGNVGHAPEVKYTPSGTPVAKFSVCTNERYKDKGGEWQDRAEWHHIVAWQRLAEVVGEYVGHGTRVYVEGRIQTREWKAKDESKRTATEIVASELIVLTGGKSEGKSEKGQGQESLPQAQSSAEITDEDIPF